MKATIKEAYAVYSTDGSGYNHGDPIAIYPFYAAAEGSTEYKKLNGYGHISSIKLLNFEDVNYLFDQKIDNNKVLGSFPIALPKQGYKHYSYHDGWDKSFYFADEDSLLSYIKKEKVANISSVILFRDIENFYLLKSEKTFTVNSFVMSRELAIQNAMNKLTEEERKLLGLK